MRSIYSEIVILIILSLAITAGSCSTQPAFNFSDCISDRDCEEGQICSDRGACEDLFPGEGVCDPVQCSLDEDCDTGQACTEGGCCIEADEAECQTDSDCAFDELCHENSCIDAVVDGDSESPVLCENAECLFDADCGEGQFCDDDCKCSGTVLDGDELVIPDGDLTIPPDGDIIAPDGDEPPPDGDVGSDDRDNDDIPNDSDNCPDTPNFDQEDKDDDGVGDACDNCPDKGNHSQVDLDEDKIGDACDNCMTDKNEDQADSDEDGLGNICDNCPYAENEDQENEDNDAYGDACDPTPDGGPVCEMVECQPVPWLDPCDDFGMECLKEDPWDPQETGYCSRECQSAADCHAPFKCGAEGLCVCDDDIPDPTECDMHACVLDADCSEYGLNYCGELDSYDGDVCTAVCDSNTACPEDYACIENRCQCERDPEPLECPRGECRNMTDCHGMGWPDASRCIVAMGGSGYCSLPCSSGGTDFCVDAFAVNWSCQQIQEQSFCICE